MLVKHILAPNINIEFFRFIAQLEICQGVLLFLDRIGVVPVERTNSIDISSYEKPVYKPVLGSQVERVFRYVGQLFSGIIRF